MEKVKDKILNLLFSLILIAIGSGLTILYQYEMSKPDLEGIIIFFSEGTLQDDVLTYGAVKLCAALAAAEHGDARRALDLLRVAGEIAERKGDSDILEDHVREAQERIERDRIIETLKSLPPHSRIVLLSVYFFAKFNIPRSVTGDIYNLYCELCEKASFNSLTQRRVSGLINELDVVGLLNSRVISLGRYGRTKKISLGISRSFIKEAFQKDERFLKLVQYKPKYIFSSLK